MRSNTDGVHEFTKEEDAAMTWQIVMDEDGSVTLPADLIARLGWTSETTLQWTEEDQGAALGRVPDPDTTST